MVFLNRFQIVLSSSLFSDGEGKYNVANVPCIHRLRLHEHGFISIRFHDFETVSKSMQFGSVYTEPFSPENQSSWYKRALHYVLN